MLHTINKILGKNYYKKLMIFTFYAVLFWLEIVINLVNLKYIFFFFRQELIFRYFRRMNILDRIYLYNIDELVLTLPLFVK